MNKLRKNYQLIFIYKFIYYIYITGMQKKKMFDYISIQQLKFSLNSTFDGKDEIQIDFLCMKQYTFN